MKKRLLSIALALVMVLALLPTAALAEEQEEYLITLTEPDFGITDLVYTIGGDETPYTYDEAFTVPAGSALTLMANTVEGFEFAHWTENVTENPLFIESVTSDVTYSPAVRVSAPVITPDVGSFTDRVTIEITCANSDAHIYFTLDGSDPSDPEGSRILYEEGHPNLSLTETTTVRAVAILEEMTSQIIQKTFNKIEAELVLSRDDESPVTASDYTYIDGVLTILGSGNYTLSMADSTESTADRVVIASAGDVRLTLDGVHIDCSSMNETAALLIAEGAGNVTVVLSGENTLKSGRECAGLQKNSEADKSLIITGTEADSLTAIGGVFGAGIGGGLDGDGSNISINAGIVTARGGNAGAGIGGGSGGNGSYISISGGIVTATSANDGAGIGGGYAGNGSYISISGGTVTATGGRYGAGIGGGYGGGNDGGNGVDISISGGTVTATGGSFAAGIGGGADGRGSMLKIDGGTVKAKGQDRADNVGNGMFRYSSGATWSSDGATRTMGNVTSNASEVTLMPVKAYQNNSIIATVGSRDFNNMVYAQIDTQTAVIDATANTPIMRTQVKLDAGGLATWATESGATLTMQTNAATLTLSSSAAFNIAKQAADRDVIISVDNVDNAATLVNGVFSIQNHIGTTRNPVNVLAASNVTFSADGKAITQFDGASVGISIPLTQPGSMTQTGSITQIGSMTVDRSLLVTTFSADGTVDFLQGRPVFSEKNVTAVSVNTPHTTDFIVTDLPYPEFTDVRETDYFKNPVIWAAANAITEGMGEKTFSPYAPCTRAQAVTFLWRDAGSPVVNYALPFTDVPADAYYTEAVRWAVSEGITDGTSATTFSPDAPCTRAQIVSFIYRMNKADTLNIKDNPFTDVAEGSYYYDAVLWAKEQKVTEGTSAMTFSPDNTCTRGQIVSFLYRYIVK